MGSAAMNPDAEAGRHHASRAQRWEDVTAWPMFVLSLAFLSATIWLLGATPLAPGLVAAATLTIAVSWLLFIADFLVRLLLHADRRAFLRRSWFEVLSLIVPYLRPFLIIAFVWRLPVFLRSSALLRARYVITIVLFALVFVYTMSTAVWLVERSDPNASIRSFGDAIWWGFTTIATVGYGDYVPVTIPGRFLAVLLMVGGIGVIGVTSATVVSLVTEQLRRAAVVAEQDREAHLRALKRSSARKTADTSDATGGVDAPDA